MPHSNLTYPRPDIAVLTLNRPEKLNALIYELVEELHATLDGDRARTTTAASWCSPARAGLLLGPGPERSRTRRRRAAAPSSRGPACGGRSASRTSPRRIHRLRQPVIAAVNGARLRRRLRASALACDIRIASAVGASSARSSSSSGLGGCDIGVELHPAADHRCRPCVRPDPDGARASTPPRRCGCGIVIARRRDSRPARRRPGHRRNTVRLRQIRGGVDQAGAVGQPRRVRAWRRRCIWRTAARSCPSTAG